MTPKENALRIIKFDNPEYVADRPPVYSISNTACNTPCSRRKNRR